MDAGAAHIVERAQSPRGEFVLRRRRDIFEIVSNGTFLMDSSDGRSERLLADVVVKEPVPRTVVIAGLGVGFTLAEVLRCPDVAKIVVVEIEEAVVRWNSGPLADVNGHALDDPRVVVEVIDFLDWLSQNGDRYDAICLDVDNGPDWTVTEHNIALYHEQSLRLMRNRLRAGGRLAVWSAAPSSEFEDRLATAFDVVERHQSAAIKGPPDIVWLAYA